VQAILEKLPDYPVLQTEEGPVFKNVPNETREVVHNTPNTITPVFPGEDIESIRRQKNIK